MDTPESQPDGPDGPQWPAQPPTEPPSGPPTSPPGTPPPMGAPPPQPPQASGQGGGGMPIPPPAPTGPTGPYRAVDALGYGWRATLANAGLLVGVTLVVLLLTALIGALTGSAGTNPSMFAIVIGQVLSAVATVPLIRASLAVVRGDSVAFGALFVGDNIGQVVLAAIILGLVGGILSVITDGLVTAFGLFGLFIPLFVSLLVSALTAYTLFFILADGRGAVDAITASASFFVDNVGALLLLFLLSVAAVIVGLLACLVGIVVAIPVVQVAQAYTFRYLRGESVATL